MSDERLPPLERLLDQAARRLSVAGLHPLHLRDRILEAFDSTVAGSDAPNDVVVRLNPADMRRLEPVLAEFRQDMIAALYERVRGGRLALLERLQLRFRPDDTVERGTANVQARFGTLNQQTAPPTAPGSTRRLQSVRGVALVLSGGERIPVLHVPFLIGRNPANDLVLASMTISRHHAEISTSARGLIIRDLGSVNGIVVDGRPAQVATVHDGSRVAIGDVECVVEVDDAT
ncbi:MAG: FhaA domain-containing protein [Dehalococcoidia bacterium]|nr:FhaA domain-containing protein [Dehalococcoidia bacterium]